MNNFNFGEVLTRAWQIIWKHRVLWIFGILASCGQGRGGSSSGGNGGSNGNGFNPNMSPRMLEFSNWMESHVMQFVIILFAFICIVWIIALILSSIGKAGLIRGASQVESGVESLIFGQLFGESTPYLWRIAGLSLILTLPVFLLAVVIAAAVIMGVVASAGGNSAVGVLGIIPVMLACLCILIPVMFVAGMIFRQAERAIVLEDLGVMPAISRGWEIFRANLGTIILMAIILAVIGFAIGLIVAIPIIIIVFPTLLAFFVSGAQSASPLIFMGVCICLYLPVALVLQGIATSYTETAWTLTYLRLTGKPAADNFQPQLDDNPAPSSPPDPENDNNQTLIAKAPPPEDANKTVISKRPDA